MRSGWTIWNIVSLRRLLLLLIPLALAIAPFGRMNMAEAKAMAHDMSSAMATHCAGWPMPDGDNDGRVAVDCMIACTAMAPAAMPFLAPPLAIEAVPLAMLPILTAGIRPEADPPPTPFLLTISILHSKSNGDRQ